MRINQILWLELHKTVGIIPKKVVAGENPKRHPSSSRVYIEKYLQLKYTESIPEKISIDQRRMESFGNDDVSILVPARKYEMG